MAGTKFIMQCSCGSQMVTVSKGFFGSVVIECAACEYSEYADE
jgi:hypothetical protein